MTREARPGARRPGLVLAAVCACTLLVMGLVAAVNLAVPQLAASPLRPDAGGVLWIVDAYVLVFASLVLPGGALGDRLGRREVLVAGLLLFAAGTALTAAAGTVPVLLAGRVLSGAGAAGVLPNCLGVLTQSVTESRRRGAVAIWATATGLGGLVGNIGGGAVLAAGSWRALFTLAAVLAVGCAGLVLAVARRSPTHPRALDPIGTVLLAGATVALVGALIEGPERGWLTPAVLGALVAAVVLAASLVVVERRSAAPILDPRLFRDPVIAGSSLGVAVTFFGSFGLFYLNASVLQIPRGWSPLQTGLAVLPLSAPLLLGAPLTPRLVARIGSRAVSATSFVAIGAGLGGIAATVRAPYPVYAAWLVVLGVGFALALPTLTIRLAAGLPPERAGLAGGLQAATRELGSAIGVAVVGSVLSAVFLGSLPPGTGGPGARSVTSVLADAAPGLRSGVLAAFAAGASTALLVAGVVTVVAGALVVALQRGGPAASER